MKEEFKKATSSLVFRMAFGIVILFLIFSIITSIIGYISFTDSFTKEYNESAFRTATTAQAIVGKDGGDNIDEYLKNLNGQQYDFTDDAYQNKWNLLKGLCNSQDAIYIYVVKVNTETYKEHYSVFNTVNPDNTEYLPRIVGESNEIKDDYVDAFHGIYEQGLGRSTIVRDDNLNAKGKPHITSLVPICNSRDEVAAVLCVERSMDELASGRQGYIYRTLLSTVVLLILSVCAIVWFIRRRFVKPTQKLIEEAKRFANENTINEAFDLRKHTGITELCEIANSLKKMEGDTVRYMENLTTVTAERERIGTELALAKRIQASVLPSLFPPFPDKKEFDIFASMTPAKEVGGDFYDFFLLDDDHLALVMADVSGKGIPAALFMMATKNLIKSHAMLGGTPSEILAKVNREICKNNADDMFVTVWLGILTISTGKIIATNAGHEYPVIKHCDGQFELFEDSHGLVVGLVDAAPYRDYEFKLGVGDTLFIYTDGAPEASDKDNTLFGTDRMLSALNTADYTPKAVLGSVQSAIDNFVGDADQFDDITMLAITMKCMQNDSDIIVSSDTDGRYLAESFLEKQIEEWDLSQAVKARLKIALDEIFANIISYSGATIVKLTLQKKNDRVLLCFEDNGIPFDPTKVSAPDTTLSVEERVVGGLGIHIVREQSSEMKYDYLDGFNVLSLTFCL